MRLPDTSSTLINCSYYFGYDPVERMYKLLKLNTTLTGRAATAAARHRQAVASFDDKLLFAYDYQDSRPRGPVVRPLFTQRQLAVLCDFQRQAAGTAWFSHAGPVAGRPGPYHRAALTDDPNVLECEILTLGRDSSWRKLDVDFGAEFVRLDADSLSINGVLYWFNQLLGPRAGLIAFHINKESFQLVKPPMQDLPLLRKSPKLKLVQFRGRVALSSIVADPKCVLVLNMLEDNEGNSWSRYVIPFPPGFGGFASIATIPVGNLPGGELLLANSRVKVSANDSGSFTPVYGYDHERNKFERYIVGKFPESVDFMDYRVKVSCLVENIAPLDDLFGQGVLSGSTGFG